MATPTFAIQRIVRTLRQLELSPPSTASNPRAEYQDVLATVHELAGEATHDDLMGWVIVETVHAQQLPAVAELRARARAICHHRGKDIPPDSPLTE